jgi:hypothetical protein
MTSAGSDGGGPFQPSGNRSMNRRSPATMTFGVTLRANARRIALPSGSVRAELTKSGAPSQSLSTLMSTGRTNFTTTIMPEVRTSAST